MSEQELGGLDGSNPLGFLAALGVLRWLTLHHGVPTARLSFREGTWRAVLHDAPPVAAWAGTAASDAKAWLDRPHLGLRYQELDKEGKPKKGKDGLPKEIRDLKPPPELFREWLRGLRSGRETEAMAFALGYAAEFGRDSSSGQKVKPTALHFYAGNQTFLKAVREIAESITEEDVTEALLGPWRYARDVKSLSWDATVSRNYALRAGDPSKEDKLGNPGADWFAYQALPLFPVVSRGATALTTGTKGGWKSGSFRWPLWRVPASLDTVADLVVLPGVQAERQLRGIVAVFESSIVRADYGSFSPSRIAR